LIYLPTAGVESGYSKAQRTHVSHQSMGGFYTSMIAAKTGVIAAWPGERIIF